MDDPRKLHKIIDLPPGLEVPVSPPKRLIKQIHNLEEQTVCGGRDQMLWKDGPKRNIAVTAYCAEPLCIDTGECPAARYVPHLPQYTELDQESPTNRRRKIDIREAVAAVREFHKRAARRGARPETRTDREIAKHVLTVWTKTLRAIGSKGDWMIGSGG
jgi:hypothetical protein